jgi:hypothetical protein
MKRQLLFVHGGGEVAYGEGMTASLRDALGGGRMRIIRNTRRGKTG